MPVDEEKLKIAFLNILVNATEAIQSTDGKIVVALDERDGDFIVEITDNGSGIPPEILSKLFEPYFTSKRNGMGLGLATTLNIIQSHKGTVDVKSKVDIGTTFTIRFPQAATADAFSVDED
jgi:signal transduction histidine kinase